MRREAWIVGAILFGSSLLVGYFGFNARSSFRPASQASPPACFDCKGGGGDGRLTESGDGGDSLSSAHYVASEPPHRAATPDVYEGGKISDLPGAARAVLDYVPTDDAGRKNSKSIFERVTEICGLKDFVGSNEFPGSISISPPKHGGWVRVSWNIGKCGGLGGAVFANPTAPFDISADEKHFRYLGGIRGPAYVLTH